MKRFFPTFLLALAAGLWGALPAVAEAPPSSSLLLPSFEVDLGTAGRTTLFALCNSSGDPVDVLVSIRSNWGIPVLDVRLTLAGHQVRTVNLRDWLSLGDLPTGKLGPDDLAHLQAALSGRASPRDHRYYGTEVASGRAAGSLTARILGLRRDVLWGDFLTVDPDRGVTAGDALLSLDHLPEQQPACARHAVRFLAGGAPDARTELTIWTDHQGEPSASPEPATHVDAEIEIYDEAGREVETRPLEILPLARLDIADLAISKPFGWFDLVTGEDSFVIARYGLGDTGAEVRSFCIPEARRAGPGLHLQQLVDGIEADLPPGPFIPPGEEISWKFVVTNNGDVPLASVSVSSDLGFLADCPAGPLEPGRSMTCTATSVAEACQRSATAEADGVPDSQPALRDWATSHYFGEAQAAIDLEVLVNGQDADEPPGPSVAAGSTVTWTYRVVNPGPVPLSNVQVTADGYFLVCPAMELAAGASMECTFSERAQGGPQSRAGAVTATTPCGVEVTDRDSAYYLGPQDTMLHIESLLNGVNAFEVPLWVATGAKLTWSHVIVNVGNVNLYEPRVRDDNGVTITCPMTKLWLEPGESMICLGSGVAAAGSHRHVATATAWFPFLPPWHRMLVTDTDTTWYEGITGPPWPPGLP